MAIKESIMVPLGTKAPYFKLSNFKGKFWSFDKFPKARGYLFIFMCNHCPFVKFVQKKLSQLWQDSRRKGLLFLE